LDCDDGGVAKLGDAFELLEILRLFAGGVSVLGGPITGWKTLLFEEALPLEGVFVILSEDNLVNLKPSSK